MQNERTTKIRRTFTIVLLVIGALLIVFPLAARLLGLDITVGFGMVQMAQLLVGLTFVTLSAFLHINSLRSADTPRSLQADIGVRLAATGLVFAYVSGFSDLLQIGTHIGPNFERPFVGPWQLGGLVVGIFIIAIGMLLYHTSSAVQTASSLAWLLRRKEQETPDPAVESTAKSTAESQA